MTGLGERFQETTTTTAVCEDGGVVCESVYDWTDSQFMAEAARWLIGTPFQIIIILGGALVLNRLVNRWIRRLSTRLGTAAAHNHGHYLSETASSRAEQRAASISNLARSASSTIIFSIAAVMILDLLGISIAPILASAGVAGLAIGFGAQRLVEDVITGLFMLIEDQFGVGDRIDVDVVEGTVEHITLRSTVIRDPNGTLWHVPNSEIRRVANESQLWSRAVVDIGVAYGTDTDAAMRRLQVAARDLAASTEWAGQVIDSPEVLGVQELGTDSINLRVITRVQPKARRQFEREMRASLAGALDEADVEMPNRQLDVWLRN